MYVANIKISPFSTIFKISTIFKSKDLSMALFGITYFQFLHRFKQPNKTLLQQLISSVVCQNELKTINR
jgi:hypothetical protein